MNNKQNELYIKLLNFDEEKRIQWERKNLPYAAVFEITPRCNLSCVHCYLRNCHQFPQLSYKQIINIIDVLYEKGILFLTLTGGEIFTRTDFIDIYMYAKKKGFLIELFSNGILIDDEIFDCLKKYPPLRIDISIYGSNSKTYKLITGSENAFDKLIENCQKLIALNIRVTLKSPIITLNYNEIDGMKKIANDLGVVFIPTFEIISSVDKEDITSQYQICLKDILKYEFEEHEKSITDSEKISRKSRLNKIGTSPINLFDCKIGKNSFVIDYSGKMCPCMKMRHRGIELTKTNFDEIWRTFNKYQLLKSSKDFKCIHCNARYYCEVCSGEMDFLYGNMEFRTESNCKYAYIRKNFYENHLSTSEALRAFEKDN